MQFVVVVPEPSSPGERSLAKFTRPTCGVGLLERTLATAQRAGASDVVLIWPQGMLAEMAEPFLRSPLLRKAGQVKLVQAKNFDPNERASWASVEDQLEERFVWLPWNWVTTARVLADPPKLEQSPTNWEVPTWTSKTSALFVVSLQSQAKPSPEGIAVTSGDTADAAERFLVARSGKVSDGIHSSFNRRLCRPVVRWLSHTRVTPNAVTFAGVLVSVLSAIAFARGGFARIGRLRRTFDGGGRRFVRDTIGGRRLWRRC